MILPLSLGIVLGAISVIFALQNVTMITVTFFSWQIEGSLALLLLLAVFMGILITLLAVLPESIRGHTRYKNLEKENKRLEEELRKQKERTVFARTVLSSPEDIEKIEKGAIAESDTL